MQTRTAERWQVLPTTWLDPRAVQLRQDMDVELGARYSGRNEEIDPQAREAIFSVDPDSVVSTLLVADADGRAIGHGALRRLGDDLEIKRIFVAPEARGRGASSALMRALEDIAAENGAPRVILQTGDRQPEAVRLYERLGYTPIPIYPPYTPIEFSLCFEKRLSWDGDAWKNGSVV